MITEDIGNMTVALGREATLKCVVTHLSDYKVKCSNIYLYLSSLFSYIQDIQGDISIATIL